MMRKRIWLAGLLAFGTARSADALVVDVTLTPSASSVAVGDSVTVDLVMLATLEAGDSVQGVLAWGLDLTLSELLVAAVGTPVLGPSWIPFVTPDGDGLGGVALEGLAGTHLLATLTLEGLAPGVVQIGLRRTANDLTEGFALDPTGFASILNLQGGNLTIVPEPASALLLLGVAAALRAPLSRRSR